ncbi:MAG: anaerobic sulfatase maturase [Ideonella sp.]|nr:anaerobic sulfatase maturase [Ideonella sp.]
MNVAEAAARAGGGLRFHAMAKPASSACNLACNYCYYIHRPGATPAGRMRSDVLEAYVRQVLDAQRGAPEVSFSWQGGEPTLAGLAFFREAVALQQRHRGPGCVVHNALQTNGTLIDDEWAAFLAEHRFLVGLSIDGPAHLHDPLRRGRDGRASHARVMRALHTLRHAGAEVNALTVVHARNWRHGREVYRFLRREGFQHLQFIPLVERLCADGSFAPPPPLGRRASISPWTPPPAGYGVFLCDVFDDWIEADVGRVFVQVFEEYAAALAGVPPSLCVYSADCSTTPIVESNGDVYCCDHYAYPAWRLGNLVDTPIGELLGSDRQLEFGRTKREPLADDCRACPFLAACVGGCPKHRFAPSSGDAALSYLCPSYRWYFAHATPRLAPLVRLAALKASPRRTRRPRSR